MTTDTQRTRSQFLYEPVAVAEDGDEGDESFRELTVEQVKDWLASKGESLTRPPVPTDGWREERTYGGLTLDDIQQVASPHGKPQSAFDEAILGMVAALRTRSPSEGRIGEWNDPKTAPRDKTNVLLLLGESIPGVPDVRGGGYLDGDGAEELGYREFAKYGGWLCWNRDGDFFMVDIDAPLGWMPIPGTALTPSSSPPDTDWKARAEELQAQLVSAALRFIDLAEIVREDGAYTNASFLQASGERYRAAALASATQPQEKT